MAKVKQIVKAAKVKLTRGRIDEFQCPKDTAQIFLWSNDPLGLAVRATPTGKKTFIYQAKINGKSMRYTIGDVGAWSIDDAEKEARRLQTLIDQGSDPRQVVADRIASEKAEATRREAEAAAKKLQEAREAVTVSKAWAEYVEATKSAWGELHLRDHLRAMQPGGEQRKRSRKLTEPGVLASLAAIRLVELSDDVVTAWAKTEGTKRPTRARNAGRLLRAFLNWCAVHPTYRTIVSGNPARSKDVKKHLGKPRAKNDSLQREQLAAWFVAVRQIYNPVISAYLQSLLLTGARPNELTTLRWEDADFQWNSLTINDKVDGMRVIPLTPYIQHLLASLPRRNEWVFSSLTSESGHLVEPRIAHDKACAVAGVDVTLNGLRRSFASLCEWIEVPVGIGKQIQGHKPQGVREQHYIRRPLDLLRKWHIQIENWILEEAGIQFVPMEAGLRVAASA